ncbi:hypothetical protein D8780_12365 [Notoacmeibacter ruber]|uniref:ArsR family transcriptional regulator n=1 Tax=Notoacmeibacter ruber TaxID=2670375 RepID=A0A3L7JFR6_9HYPH|nr:hypothetical protein D8780_12365 [Notoacmeibacter ruber]
MESHFAGFRDHYDGNARLIILRALNEQGDGRLNDSLLLKTLQTFGINKGRDYLRQQLAWLETEAGVVRTTDIGTAQIVQILEAGEDHVEQRRVLPGIAKPSRPRA